MSEESGSGRPGRPVGTSPDRYSFDEIKVIFNMLLDREPINPCGVDFLKELHVVSLPHSLRQHLKLDVVFLL